MLFFLIIAGAVWAASGVSAWLESREQTDEFFDTYQLMLARQLASADWKDIKPGTQRSVDHIIDGLDDDGEEEDEALGLAVFDAHGNMIFHDNENGRYFRYAPASGFVNQKLADDDEMWRIVWVKSTDGQYSIAVGQELDYRNDIALEMIEATFIPWVCGLGILLVAIIGLISKEFLPLKKLACSLAERESDNLAPIDEQNVPSWLKAPVGQAFMQASHVPQRGFTGASYSSASFDTNSSPRKNIVPEWGITSWWLRPVQPNPACTAQYRSSTGAVSQKALYSVIPRR